jgi:hypothetical protein
VGSIGIRHDSPASGGRLLCILAVHRGPGSGVSREPLGFEEWFFPKHSIGVVPPHGGRLYKKMQQLAVFLVTTAVCGTFAAAQQVGCLATNGSVVGSYTYVATELPLSGVVISPPGTTSNQYSNSSIGQLLGNINTGAAFSSAGVLYFDGAGHILVATTASPLAASTQVGTYTVNSDCTITVTLTDVFNTTTSGPGVTNPTFGTSSLIGIVLGGGTELDLSVAQSLTSTNGNMPVMTGEFASRLFIQLIRSFPYGCSVASLTGSYGLVGTGYALLNPTTSGTTTTGTTQPVIFFASVTFDGNGNVVPQTVTSPSPLGNFQYAGTYTMNLNCTGTLTLSAPPKTSTTGTTTTSTTPLITANFVLIPPVAYVTTGTASLTGSADRPSLLFTTSNSTEVISGYGRAQ